MALLLAHKDLSGQHASQAAIAAGHQMLRLTAGLAVCAKWGWGCSVGTGPLKGSPSLLSVCVLTAVSGESRSSSASGEQARPFYPTSQTGWHRPNSPASGNGALLACSASAALAHMCPTLRTRAQPSPHSSCGYLGAQERPEKARRLCALCGDTEPWGLPGPSPILLSHFPLHHPGPQATRQACGRLQCLPPP